MYQSRQHAGSSVWLPCKTCGPTGVVLRECVARFDSFPHELHVSLDSSFFFFMFLLFDKCHTANHPQETVDILSFHIEKVYKTVDMSSVGIERVFFYWFMHWKRFTHCLLLWELLVGYYSSIVILLVGITIKTESTFS